MNIIFYLYYFFKKNFKKENFTNNLAQKKINYNYGNFKKTNQY